MTNPSIKKNFIYNTLYEILAIIAPLITAPYVARIFEADGTGIYSRTTAIATYFTMFAALGIKSYGQREIAQHRDNSRETSKIFWELEIMCVFTTLLCMIFWVFVIVFSKDYSIYYFALSLTIIATAFDISWFWAGYEEYKVIVIRNSLVKILGIVLVFTLIHKKSDLLRYVVLLAATGLLGNVSMWFQLPKYLQKVNVKTLSFRHHFKETLVYFIPTVATSIYTILDKAMIGWITNDDYENGYYEQATKVLGICKALVFSIITVVSSRMSFLFAQNDNKEVKERLENTMNFVMLFALPMMFGVIGVARRLVPLYFGEGYEPVIGILYILGILLPVIGVSNSLGSLYFTPSGQRARSNKAIITGSVVNLIMNLILIPYIKSVGAAIASVMAEVTITVMYIYMAKDFFNAKCLISFSWKRLISSIIMCSVVIFIGYQIENSILCLCLQSIVGVICYGGLLFLFHDKFFTDNTIKVLNSFLRKNT